MLVIPYEGRAAIARYLLGHSLVDRDEGLLLGLFTNVTADLNLGLATVTEPTGIAYAHIPLDDLDWSVDAVGTAASPGVEFMAGAGGWSGIVQGYFIRTNAPGGTPRMLCYEFDTQQQLVAAAMTALGAVVSVVTPSAHRLTTGGLVNVRGAAQSAYNGIFSVTVTGSNSFTYTVSGSPASPATGVILVNRCFQMDVGARYGVTPVLTVGG